MPGNLPPRTAVGPADMAAALLAASLLLLAAQAACEFGILRVVPQSGGTRGRDYCILYNPQWAHLPHDLNKVSLLKLRDLSATQLCSYLDVPVEDFTNQIALVARGNCTFYEKVRLAQGSGAHGLLIVSKERLVECSALWYLWGVGKLREPCLRMLRKTEVRSGGTGLWGHGPLSWGWCHWGWRLVSSPCAGPVLRRLRASSLSPKPY